MKVHKVSAFLKDTHQFFKDYDSFLQEHIEAAKMEKEPSHYALMYTSRVAQKNVKPILNRIMQTQPNLPKDPRYFGWLRFFTKRTDSLSETDRLKIEKITERLLRAHEYLVLQNSCFQDLADFNPEVQMHKLRAKKATELLDGCEKLFHKYQNFIRNRQQIKSFANKSLAELFGWKSVIEAMKHLPKEKSLVTDDDLQHNPLEKKAILRLQQIKKLFTVDSEQKYSFYEYLPLSESSRKEMGLPRPGGLGYRCDANDFFPGFEIGYAFDKFRQLDLKTPTFEQVNEAVKISDEIFPSPPVKYRART